MATITGLTAERMRQIEAASIVDGDIDVSGHLILTRYDGSQIDAGSALVAVPDENIVKILNASGFTNATPSSSYPEGMSLMYLNDVQATSGGWPFPGKWGAIRTVHVGSPGDAAQIWQRIGDPSATSELWFRGGNIGGWSAWKRIASQDQIDTIDGSLSTINGNISTINGNISTINGNISTINSDITTLDGRIDTLEAKQWPLYAIQGGFGTVSSGVLSPLGFATVPLSPANGYIRGVDRITVPSPGSYHVSYRFVFSGAVSGRSFVELIVASLTNYQYSIPADVTTFGRNGIAAGENVGVVSAQVALNSGAQIGMNAFQSSGAARSVDGVLHVKRIA